MRGSEVRSSFIDFFQKRDHEIVPSASLIPNNDPTLLFTNAGMVQFKNVFLGSERRAHSRAVDAQRCLRLSGKHNDLEEVGRDTYHHTLFEMLGNWSFGDYYKAEAIAWAWELLTDEWKLPKDKLWASVYRSDDEAETLWKSETDIAHDRILRFGEKDNFWEMGDIGPCGPCSEIHIDRGPEACDRKGVREHRCEVNGDCARFTELWNLVFIQHNRIDADTLEDLEHKHVDTGAGLERLAAVMQGVLSNYDTDLFQDIIRFAADQSSRRYGENEDDDLAFRVIADHARAVTFMVADGVQPSNEGRGYVLRRVLRRAARHARHLGFEEPFLCKASKAVVDTMGSAYPEIVERAEYVEQVIRSEEERFTETLDKGLFLLEQEKTKLTGSGSTVLSGDIAFKLYDTYGFPLDMTQDILRSDGIDVDLAGFESSMGDQRQRGRDSRKGGMKLMVGSSSHSTRFVGDRDVPSESVIDLLLVEGEEKQEVRAGEEVQIVVPETPFYGESGGQVGDRGTIISADGRVEILDTQKPRNDLTVHVGKVVEGNIAKGDRVTLQIDDSYREGARLNHSATHILHAVLREELGEGVGQAGSLVASDRLRFDITYPGAIDEEVLRKVEETVNRLIRGNADVYIDEMSFDDAIEAGALAFFGDKYGDRVRVVKMGDYSTELCGGTHVARAGDIGFFKLRGESGVAAGVRRIEAYSGKGALDWIEQRERMLSKAAALLKGGEDEIAGRIARLLEQQKELQAEVSQLRSKMAGSRSGDLLEQVRDCGGTKVLAAVVDGVDDQALRTLSDRLRDQIGSGVVVLGTQKDDRALLLAAVTSDLTNRFHAGKLIKEIAPLIGGGGGGKAEMAQAGGKKPEALAEAIEAVYRFVS